MQIFWGVPVYVLTILLTLSLGGCIFSSDSSGGSEEDRVKESLDLYFEKQGPIETVISEAFSNPLQGLPSGIRVNYTSSDETVATIDDKGEVRLNAKGNTIISATVEDSDKYSRSQTSYELIVESYYFDNDICANHSSYNYMNYSKNIFDFDIELGYCVGRKDNGLKIKEIPIEITSPEPNFALGEKAFFSQSPNSDYVYYTYDITNIGPETRCFVSVEGIKLLDENSENLINDEDNDFSFVNGSTFYRNSISISYTTASCLKPSEKGFFTGINKVGSLDNISSFRISNVSSTDALQYEFEGITSMGYEWQSTSQIVSLAIVNNSMQSAEEFASQMVLFDENDRPVRWTFFTSNNRSLPVGSETTLQARAFDTLSPKIRVHINMDVHPTVALRSNNIQSNNLGQKNVYNRVINSSRNINALTDSHAPDEINEELIRFRQESERLKVLDLVR